MSLMDILSRYANPGPEAAGTAEAHYDQVAPNLSPSELGHGVTETLKSDRTPPFGDMVGNLFGQSNPQQRAGVLNQILASIGPNVLSGIAGGALGRILGGSTATPTPPSVTPEQASQLTPEQVRDLADHAEKQDPGVVDKVGSFYGQHPDLVKGLGAMALAVLLGKMAKR